MIGKWRKRNECSGNWICVMNKAQRGRPRRRQRRWMGRLLNDAPEYHEGERIDEETI